METFLELKRNSKKPTDGFDRFNLAVLGDSATQFLKIGLIGSAWNARIQLDLWEADFDQILNQVFDMNSDLYESNRDGVLLYYSSEKLWHKFNKTNADEREGFASKYIAEIEEVIQTIGSRSEAKIIIYNLAEFDDAVFGNLTNRVTGSFLFQIRKFNYELMLLSQRTASLFVVDLNAVQSRMGREHFHAANIQINSDVMMSLEATAQVAQQTLKLIASMKGRSKKCLILDLDNTLWGGIVGDDGYEHLQIGSLGIGKAFSNLQWWAKRLQERGIILAVCSKNFEEVAKEPFEKHPDMVLKLSDIAVFVANWENKADNIRHIQQILNIGFDSMVFLDDNPFERNIVRTSLPEVLVPELPEDPALYLEYLQAQNIFDTIIYSSFDKQRTEQYQTEAKRATLLASFTNESEYLQSLNMTCEVEAPNRFNIPRIAQLSQRSNQFNLRTVRLTEADLLRWENDKSYEVMSFSLADRYGDYGLVCVVILKDQGNRQTFIENWFMSCRVLKRGMENFTLNTIVEKAIERGWDRIHGEYIPTTKNAMVSSHFSELGFLGYNGLWTLEVSDYERKETFISKLKNPMIVQPL